MTLLPIVVRELRVGARRPATYWLRTGAALALIVFGTTVFLVTRTDQPNERSQAIFGVLTAVSVLYALLSGIRDTADSLSWEKREGTLGLLFLTDLKGYDVVLGKLVANSINAFYTVVAVLPMMAVPLLMGGITIGEFGRTALVVLNTLFFSLSAGICISGFSRSLHRAAGGTALVILTFSGFIPLIGGLMLLGTPTFPAVPWFMLSSPGYTYYQAWAAPYKLFPERFWWSLGTVHALGWIFLFVASFVAPRSWQDKPAGARKLRWRERWKTWGHGNSQQRYVFRKQLLDVNGFFWLAARDRLKPWYVWLSLTLIACGWMFGYYKLKRDWLNGAVFVLTAIVLSVLIKAWYAAESSRQIAEERKSGALELLLSTPLTIRELLRGQLLALQRQFLGPIVTILFVMFLLMWKGRQENIDTSDFEDLYFIFWIGTMVTLIGDLAALHYVGMWQALTARNPGRAASSTVLQVLILPGIIWVAIWLLAALAAMRGGDLPSGKIMLGLWYGLGLASDLFFGATARHRLLTQFRLMAEQRFSPRPGLWQRLFSSGKG